MKDNFVGNQKYLKLMNEKKELSRSASVVARTMYEAMKIMKENNGAMAFSAITEKLPEVIAFTEWEQERTSEKTPQPRWLVNTIFYSVEYARAALIRKEAGVWYLTEDGEKALSLSPEEVFAIAHTAYREYQKENGKHQTIDEDVEEVEEMTEEMILAEAEGKAWEGVARKIRTLSPYEFQDVCGALLRAMGYYTPFIAPKGKDGGIDIEAYENPTGVGERIFAQVKHMPTTAVDVTVVRNLAALLKKNGDAGIVFSSGTFTNDAIRFARENKNNIRLIGATELIRLWIDYYDMLTEEDRALLPLKAVYYVAR
jgi:restriction system protein